MQDLQLEISSRIVLEGETLECEMRTLRTRRSGGTLMRMFYACADCGCKVINNDNTNEAIPLEYCPVCANYSPEVYIKCL